MSAHEPEYLKHLSAEEIATVAYGTITGKNKQIAAMVIKLAEARKRIAELEIERDQWQESCGQNYVRAETAEDLLEALERFQDEHRNSG